MTEKLALLGHYVLRDSHCEYSMAFGQNASQSNCEMYASVA